MTDRLLVIHGLAIKKGAGAAEVAHVLGEQTDDVVSALDSAVSDGHAIGAKGRYLLTPAGQQSLTEWYDREFSDLRLDGGLAAAYEEFEHVNRKLLQLFTDWQTIEVGGELIPNDHSDSTYDNQIIDQLGDLHEFAEPIFERLESFVPRMAVYRGRLDAAYERVLAGEHEYVSGVKVDSYHTAWFELHEDLLRILGREREEG